MAATAPMPGLHGREAETSVLSRALDRAAAGRLAVVLGEAGIGKTRLLAETLTHARERGMRVAAGRAGELESARPFGVIAEALECARPSVDPHRSAIAALLSTRGGDGSPITVSSDPGLQFRAVDAITDLAEELAVDRPLVIGLDDLQWADQSSLLTLAALGRRLAGLPAALIACFRPSPRAPALQHLAGTGPANRMYGAMWAPALLLEASGDIAGALAAVAGLWDQCVRSGAVVECPVLGADLVRLAIAAGDAARAAEVAAVVAQVAAEVSAVGDVPSLTGAALYCRGLAHDDAGLLADAVESYSRGPRPLELAVAAEDAGRAMGRLGRLDHARGLLDRAAVIYEGLEAARDLARTEATMRQLGVRRGVRGRRDRPQTGWPSLTVTERTVANLVAEGLSNPQIGERLFISRGTVQTHVAHIFMKLGISSRAQLAAEVIRQPSRG